MNWCVVKKMARWLGARMWEIIRIVIVGGIAIVALVAFVVYLDSHPVTNAIFDLGIAIFLALMMLACVIGIIRDIVMAISNKLAEFKRECR